MKIEDLKILVQEIVEEACKIKDKHTNEKGALVNYAAIFSQSQDEYELLLKLAKKMGRVVRETPTGPLFQIDPLGTVSGKLMLLKIRMPDKTRPERGDADFTVENYIEFKRKYLPKPGFELIERQEMEMIELMDPSFNVRTYFSHPPLDQQLGLSTK